MSGRLMEVERIIKASYNDLCLARSRFRNWSGRQNTVHQTSGKIFNDPARIDYRQITKENMEYIF